MQNKIKDTIYAWLSQNNLKLYDLLSMAFVPLSTYESVLEGKKSNSTYFRLHFVTGIEGFALSDAELDAYVEEKKFNNGVQIDEDICRHFVKVWKEEGRVPDIEDRLLITRRDRQDKIVLAAKLRKKYLLKADKVFSDALFEKFVITAGVIESIVIQILDGDEEKIAKFRRQSGTELTRVYTLLSICMSENPKQDFITFKNHQ